MTPGTDKMLKDLIEISLAKCNKCNSDPLTPLNSCLTRKKIYDKVKT